jgi:hypothetical protein
MLSVKMEIILYKSNNTIYSLYYPKLKMHDRNQPVMMYAALFFSDHLQNYRQKFNKVVWVR